MSDFIDLHCGDCLEVLPTITRKVDFIVADIPYGTTQAPWDSFIPFDDMWEALKSHREDRTPVALFGSEPFASQLRMSNLKEFKYDFIWEKSKATNWLNAKRQPMRAHETVSLFYRKPCVYNPQMTEGCPYDKGVRKEQTAGDVYGDFSQARIKSEDGRRYPRSVQYFKTAETEGKTFHKTQKPLALLEYLIRTYTNEGDTVLDFTMGSGSTAVAAINTGRNFIGIELEREFYDSATARVARAAA